MTDQAESAAPETPKFINGATRAKSIPLVAPLAYAGKEYRTITLVRLTAGEVARFLKEIETASKDDPNASIRFPIFRDDAGSPVPDIVLDALDDDDKFALDEAATDFLPRRFRGATEPDSARSNGGNIALTSAA
jgi:hypothetical protein